MRIVGRKTAEGYQERIGREVGSAIASYRSGAVLAPTGSGKSLAVAMAAEDAREMRRPILVLHPSVDLLRQNLAQIRECLSMTAQPIGLFTDKSEKVDRGGDIRRGVLMLDGVTLATNNSIVNLREDPGFNAALDAFGEAGGVVVIDEGQRAAAEKLGLVLGRAARAGAIGIVLSATPFRTDERDPLEPFGTTVEESLVALAEHDEVQATGRTLPTLFDLANAEFAELIGEQTTREIESLFEGLIESGKSIDDASRETFARYFAKGATDAERRVGEAMANAIARIWRRRAADRHLAMLHCDGIGMAEAVAQATARSTLPEGHPQGGSRPRVGYVTGSETVVYEHGKRVDVRERFGWGKGAARTELLALASRGGIDVLVNVTALGVGTDVPVVDLNIVASWRKSIGPLKQVSGRGERASKATGKRNQLLVDIGNSVATHWRDVDYLIRGETEYASHQMARIDARIRRQFRQWFDGDPTLAGRVAADEERRRRRMLETEEREDVEDVAPRGMTRPPPALLPVPQPFADGIVIALARAGSPGSRKTKLWMTMDLGACGILREGANLPKLAAVVYDERSDRADVHMCSDMERARTFGTFMGVRPGRPGTAEPPTDRQAWAIASRGPRTVWLTGGLVDGFAPTQTKGEATASLAAHFAIETVTRAVLSAVGRHAFGDSGLSHPINAIAFDRPDAIGHGRRAAIQTYVDLCGRLGLRAPRAIVFAPGARAEAAEVARVSAEKVFDASDPAHADRIRDDIRRGLLKGTQAAWSGTRPGSSDWLRRRLGLPPRSKAVERREELVTAFLDRRPPRPVARHPGRFVTLWGDADECRDAVDVAPSPGPVRSLAPRPGEAVANIAKVLDRALFATTGEVTEDLLRSAPRGIEAIRAIATGRADALTVDKGEARVAILSQPPGTQDALIELLTRWEDETENRRRVAALSASPLMANLAARATARDDMLF